MKVIGFNKPTGDNGYLSIYYQAPFYQDGLRFETVEQCFLYQKALTFHDEYRCKKILQTSDSKILNQLVKEVKDEPLYEEEKVLKHVLYKFKEEKPFTIDKEGNTYIIKGDKVEKIFKMINFNTEEAIPRFSKRLRTLGIEDALEEMGIKEGDIVRVLDYEFEYTK